MPAVGSAIIAIIWKQPAFFAIVCDCLRSAISDLRSAIYDRLRSSAIIWKPALKFISLCFILQSARYQRFLHEGPDGAAQQLKTRSEGWDRAGWELNIRRLTGWNVSKYLVF